MRYTLSNRWRACAALFGLVMLLVCVSSATADPKPLTKEEQQKVDKAIDKGIVFLKRIQHKEGDWPLYMRNGYALGQTLLPAYALLEAGVPANDPALKKAADYVRPRVLKLERTYEIALAILFLDRLGDPKDEPLIHSLALRLIAGQHVTGGWNYRCPLLSKDQEDALSKALPKLHKGQEQGQSMAKFIKEIDLSRALRSLAVFREPNSLPWREPHDSPENLYRTQFVGTTDNSNTQFAMLALWAAQRHTVATGPTFRLVAERFQRTQLEDGWWPYLFHHYEDPAWIKRHPSMICAGLLGLALGQRSKTAAPRGVAPVAVDIRILKSLAALERDLGVAAGDLEGAPSMRGTYYLWSVERVGMLYDLPTIGEKDWYRWGATILIASQRPDGSWKDVKIDSADHLVVGPNWGLVPPIDTSFALLFLKRSHPMKDLTPKLPAKGKELNAAIIRFLSGDSPLRTPRTIPSKAQDRDR